MTNDGQATTTGAADAPDDPSTIGGPTPELEPPRADGPASEGPPALLATLAVASLGAAGIHFAHIGHHAELSAWQGAFFAAAAWFQALWALLVVTRPRRWVLWAGVVGNAAIVTTWLVARTVGVPVGPDPWTAEPVAWYDAAATAFAAAVILGSVAVLAHRVPRLSSTVAAGAFGAVAATVAIVTSLTLVPSVAGEHDHGGGGAAAAHAHGTTTADATTASGHDHGVPADPTTAGADATAATGGEHQHAAAPLEPLSAEERRQLGEELVAVRSVADRFPTAADAEAAGYLPAGPVGQGAGAHYVNTSLAGETELDIQQPMALLYEDIRPDAAIVGVMYYSAAEGEPEGFTGPNDHWHQHAGACFRLDGDKIFVPFRVDADVTREQCEAIEGTEFLERTGWMLHVWVAPGWESDHGVFSHDNPAIVCPSGTQDTGNLGTGCQPV